MFKFFKRLGKEKETKKVKNQSEGNARETELPDKIKNNGGKDKGKEKPEGKLRDKGKLFVGGLNHETTSEALKAYFSRFGVVVDAVVMRYPDTLKSRGYGFVTFANPAVADGLENGVHRLDGNIVDVRRFVSGPRKRDARIFLGGVPLTVTQNELKDFFARYGEVESVMIPRDRLTNKPKGFAFVNFKDKQAAELCLAERFVYFGGKRIIVSKAVPKCRSRESLSTPDSYAEGDPEVDEGFAFDDCSFSCGDDVEPATDVDSHSSASEDRLSAAEIIPGFQQVIGDYFKEKMAFFEKMNKENRNEKDGQWQPQENHIKEMEMLLTKLLVNSGEVDTTANDLINFSSDNESAESTDDDDDDDDCDSEDDDGVVDSSSPFEYPFPGCPNRLSARLPEILAGRPMKTSREEISKSSSGNEYDCVAFQRPSAPLKIKDGEGSCNLCSWKSPDGSAEALLQHHRSAGHQLKLKERFLPEERKAIHNGQQEIYSRLLSEEAVSKTQEPKKQGRTRTHQKNKNKKLDQGPRQEEQLQQQRQQQQQQLQQQKQQQQQKKKKPMQNDTKVGQKENVKCAEQNPENEEKNSLNLKAQALAKSMIFIQPMEDNRLKCKMCDKVIPKAQDFNNLMKNVSFHLQGKKHLNKLSEAEDSMMKTLNQNSSGVGKSSDVQTNLNQKKEEKTVQKKVTQKNIPKVEEPMAETGKSSECAKSKTTNKKKPEKSASALETKFLCVLCNFFSSDKGTFNGHLNSKSHKENHKNEGDISNDFWSNCGVCKGCKSFLYGSLFNINKHYVKCQGKKN